MAEHLGVNGCEGRRTVRFEGVTETRDFPSECRDGSDEATACVTQSAGPRPRDHAVEEHHSGVRGSNPGSGPGAPTNNPSASLEHGALEQTRAHLVPQEPRRGATMELDQSSAEASDLRHDRARRGRGTFPQEVQDSPAVDDWGNEPHEPEEGHAHQVRGGGAQAQGDAQRRDQLDPAPPPEPLHEHGDSGGRGHDGLREVFGDDLPPCLGERSEVCRVGKADQPGGRLLSVSPPVCTLGERRGLRGRAGDPYAGQAGVYEVEESSDEEGLPEQDPQRATIGGGELKLHRAGGDAAGQCGDSLDEGGPGLEGGEGREASQDHGPRRCTDGEAQGQALSLQASRVLDPKVQDLVPGMFEELI